MGILQILKSNYPNFAFWDWENKPQDKFQSHYVVPPTSFLISFTPMNSYTGKRAYIVLGSSALGKETSGGVA